MLGLEDLRASFSFKLKDVVGSCIDRCYSQHDSSTGNGQASHYDSVMSRKYSGQSNIKAQAMFKTVIFIMKTILANGDFKRQ